MDDPLRRALRRARELSRPVLAADSLPVRGIPVALELFASAEARGERRFFSGHPDEEHELLGLGCAWELAPGSDGHFSDIRERAREAFAHCVSRGPVRPCAVGGFAFEPRAVRDPGWREFGNARFAIPEVALERSGEQVTLTRAAVARPDDDEDALLARQHARWKTLLTKSAEPARAPAPATLQPGEPPASSPRYRDAAAKIVAAIRRGELQKVVLAQCERRRRAPNDATRVLRALLERNPSCRTFAQGIHGRTFLGASPERIVRCDGGELVTDALAGTVANSDDAEVRSNLGSSLRSSQKNQEEHEFVVRAIERSLAPICSNLQVPMAPELVSAGVVQHLRTRVCGRLSEGTHVLDVLARLHPTPAVAGTPTNRALATIRAYEDFDRGWYAGAVGSFDARGDGEFFVALRCGLLDREETWLFAGSGLVADSDPLAEANETALKYRPLWEALRAR